MNAAYERYFAEQYPARTTLGVSELLGGASVQLDAVVAVEQASKQIRTDGGSPQHLY